VLLVQEAPPQSGSRASTDVPVDHADRVYLVERHVHSYDELAGLAAEYAARTEQRRMAAILAITVANPYDETTS
jgi:hypothetical protein